MDSRTRLLTIEQFRTDPARRVLFSTDAGGLGLNLQDAASVVVNLEVRGTRRFSSSGSAACTAWDNAGASRCSTS
jgi:hypothetical protein